MCGGRQGWDRVRDLSSCRFRFRRWWSCWWYGWGWLVVDCWRRHCMTWGWVAATGHWTSEREALCIVSVISPRLPRTGLGTLPATLLQHTLFKCKWASFRNINVRPSRHRLTPSCRAHSVGLEASTTTPHHTTLINTGLPRPLSLAHSLFCIPSTSVRPSATLRTSCSIVHTYICTYTHHGCITQGFYIDVYMYIYRQHCIHRHNILKLLNLSTRMNYYYELKTVIML